jgi:hypothetical protein
MTKLLPQGLRHLTIMAQPRKETRQETAADKEDDKQGARREKKP